MAELITTTTSSQNRKGVGGWYLLLIILITITVTAGASYWFLSRYVFLTELKPVELRVNEEQVLNKKLRTLGVQVGEWEEGGLQPEPYSEAGASRDVFFSERELNALLAKNTNLAHRMAIDLSDDLVSMLLLVPVDEGFPVLGGKTLRLHTGAELSYREGRPRVMLKGMSFMGVPIPNAWLGNLKNVDLVDEFGGEQGFWRSFAEGVEDMQVKSGQLQVRLKE